MNFVGVVAKNASRGVMQPGVAMVKAGDPQESDDATGGRRFDSPRDRGVSVERHMRAVLVSKQRAPGPIAAGGARRGQ